MLVTLVCVEKVYELRLPKKITGQYWIIDEEELAGKERILSIEADIKNQKWKISSSKTVQIYQGNYSTAIKSIALEEGQIYSLQLGRDGKQRAFLFVDSYKREDYIFTKYILHNGTRITIGAGDRNSIVIKNALVSQEHAELVYKNQVWTVTDKDSANGIYVNRNHIYGSQNLNVGDVLFFMGCKIILGQGFLAINNPGKSVSVNTQDLYIYEKQELIAYEAPELEEEVYYYRSPILRRKICPLQFRIDAPPPMEKQDSTPVFLTLAPTIMMGIASLISGVISVFNVVTEGGEWLSVLPTLAMSVSMLCGMVLFPLIVKRREKKVKARFERERHDKYLKYLDNVRKEISKAQQQQKEIIEENYAPILRMISLTDFWDRGLWNRIIGEDDFLTLRLGSGNIPLEAELSFPENRFSLEDDNLEKALQQLREEEQLVSDAAITISFSKQRVVGVYGAEAERRNLLLNLLLQIAALHSYDEIKIIFLCEKKDSRFFDFVKWMPHIWNNERTVRYFAESEEDVRALNSIICKEFRKREEEKDKASVPYYLIISTSKYLADRSVFVSDMLEKKEIQNVGMLVAYSELKELPKECNAIVSLYDDRGLLQCYGAEHSQRLSFVQDKLQKDIVKEIVKKINRYKLDLQKGKYVLPGMVTFMDMFRVGNIEHLNIVQRWLENSPIKSLQTPIGVDASGEAFMLDLHEKFHGPHGLVAGMTGSGKSEFIITYILSMAINYHPNEVAFVLIDYKGGGLAGAFDNERYRLPHLVGTITNLDSSSIMRSILAIKSELRRRQMLFNDARNLANEGTMDIYKYQKMYRSGSVEAPIPHLFIITDEFAELKVQQPEFMEQLISIARIGRSLGVHLILATQKPAGVVNEQIWANSRFRVCLKVQDKSDSMDMLKRGEAAELSETGRFYLQVGNNELFEMGQSAWCGAPYVEKDIVEEELDSTIQFIDNVGSVVEDIKLQKEAYCGSNKKQIVRIMEYLSHLAIEEGIEEHCLWLPELPSMILVDELRKKYNYQKGEHISAVVGEIDNPYGQSQECFVVDFVQDGNVLLYGVAGSGKTTFITALLYSLAQDYSETDWQTYVLDFGAETLRMFEKAPQVCDVIVDGEDDKVDKLFERLGKEIIERKKIIAEMNTTPIPEILIIINNYSQFMDSYEKYEERLISLTRECTKYGIYFLITETSASGIRYRLAQNFHRTLVLQLNDKAEYIGVLGNTSGVYPSKIKGRGVFKSDEAYIFQVAQVTEDDNKTVSFIKDMCMRMNAEAPQDERKIVQAPEAVSESKLCVKEIKQHLRGLDAIPLGINVSDASVEYYDFIENHTLQVLSKELKQQEAFDRMLIDMLGEVQGLEMFLFKMENGLDDIEHENCHLVINGYEEKIRSLFQIAVERNNNYKKTCGNPTVDMHPIVCVFQSLYQLKTLISEDGYSKLTTMIDKVSSEHQMIFIILEKAQSLKQYYYEEWYAEKYQGKGIWIGEGVEEQMQLPADNINSQMVKQSIDDSIAVRIEMRRARLLRVATQEEAYE